MNDKKVTNLNNEERTRRVIQHDGLEILDTNEAVQDITDIVFTSDDYVIEVTDDEIIFSREEIEKK